MATLCLLIQDKDDVARGVGILRGLRPVPIGAETLQFSFDVTDHNSAPARGGPIPGVLTQVHQAAGFLPGLLSPVNVAVGLWHAYSTSAEEENEQKKAAIAKEHVGGRGNEAVMTHLTDAIRSSSCALHVRFAYCNLSPETMTCLAEALKANASLTGFSCFGNPDGWFKDQSAFLQAVAETRAPLQTWNGRELPTSVIAQRRIRADSPSRADDESASVPAPVRSPPDETTVLAEMMEELDPTKPTIMISYQWNSQVTAIMVRDYLVSTGRVNVIIDIKGMKGNILAWMEAAVRKSHAIIILITPEYASSWNCEKEACRAHELRKKVIPIKLKEVPDEKVSKERWLPMLIAGLLYYDGTSDASLRQSLSIIVERELPTLRVGHASLLS